MANYPYISGQGALIQALGQLRKGFPAKVDAGYLKRFNIAPANESYVISILRFLELIDAEGNKVEDHTTYFYAQDEAFQSGLETNLRSAYAQLFEEMGDGALEADRGDLTHWFRASDKTSDLVGQRQASTFQTLAALAGHRELPAARSTPGKKVAASSGRTVRQVATKPPVPAKKAVPAPRVQEKNAGGGSSSHNGSEVGLTVRVEVNLPPGGDAETYDSIFASIKKHLMS